MTHLNPPATRRDFILSSGVFAAGALMGPTLGVGQQKPSEEPKAHIDPEDELERLKSVDGITASTIVEAEKLANIAFTHAERDMIADSISDQLERSIARLKHRFHPNTLAPALVFDPNIPGGPMPRFVPPQAQVNRSRIDPSPLPENDEDIAFAPITRLARWIEQRQITSARLTKIYLERLKKFDPQIKCVITLCEEHAKKQAAQADREIAAGRYRGPLHGIPWGAKDLLDTAGITTTWGAEPFVDRVPADDAAVVKRLNDAGAVLVAKLSLGALAYNDIWFGGRTNNPWNLKQGSSGSSAGSAAATAAGLVGFAIGSETYGSITSPCMRCGTTGLRPTFGRISRAGAMALCWSLDKIGPICRSVEDCILVLAAMNGGADPDPLDPSYTNSPLHFDADMPLKEVRVGFNPKWFNEEPAHELDRHALGVLRTCGVQLVEVDLPDWPYDSLLNILMCEAAAAFEELTRTNQDELLKWQDAAAWPNSFRKAWFIPGIEVVQADRFRRQCMAMMAEVIQKQTIDTVIAPSFAASLCLITNNTGHPSLTLRCGFRESRDGVQTPYGITLIGRLFDEGTLCCVGAALEKALGVAERRPHLGV